MIMKNKLFLFASAAMIAVACNNNPQNEIPSKVQSAFEEKYPGAELKKWEVEKENGQTIYEVKFKVADQNKEAEFDENGTFLKEEDRL